MTSDELKKDCRKTFPSLKKPFWGRDVIDCRDGEYKPNLPHEVYVEAYHAAWAIAVAAGVEYDDVFPDCDDYADILLGLVKLEWVKAVAAGKIPKKTSPVYSVIEGYNPQGENHNYSYFRSSAGRFIADYSNIIPITGYRPMRQRF